jgi:hypothetical protein
MVTLAVEKGGSVPSVGPSIKPGTEFVLRVIGAALQIITNLAVVRLLPPDTAGIYFRGVVIAYGLSAVLRGKYDLFIAHCFISEVPLNCGVPHRALVRALGIRVLIRSAIACALLLVFTSDLDVMETHFRPYLETYLPFVLAVPLATLAWFLAASLRAVNRTLGSVIVSTYCMNVVILITATVLSGSPPEDAFLILSWAFLAGAAVAAVAGVLVTRRVFEASDVPPHVYTGPDTWKRIYASASSNGLNGLAMAGLQWGPLCVLAILAPAAQIAEYAVVTRTVQIIDFLIPGVLLVPQSLRFQSRFAHAMRSLRGKLAVDLAVSLATTSAYVLAVGLLTPWFANLYGPPYNQLTALFVLLLLMQWVSGACRPALRQLAAYWDLGRIRFILLLSAAAAILVSVIGVPQYGPLAAAAGALVGVVLENGLSVVVAFREVGGRD